MSHFAMLACIFPREMFCPHPPPVSVHRRLCFVRDGVKTDPSNYLHLEEGPQSGVTEPNQLLYNEATNWEGRSSL